MIIRKHKFRKGEVSFIELKEDNAENFKVTRRLPELNVAETKIFQNRKKARMQFREWLK